MQAELVILPRAGGKTTRMLEWMRAAPPGEHRVLVCIDQMEADRLRRENPDLEDWQFKSVGLVKRDLWGSGSLLGRDRIVLGVDNLDLVLAQLLRWPVGMVTWNG